MCVWDEVQSDFEMVQMLRLRTIITSACTAVGSLNVD
jgi:hypothetical protein